MEKKFLRVAPEDFSLQAPLPLRGTTEYATIPAPGGLILQLSTEKVTFNLPAAIPGKVNVQVRAGFRSATEVSYNGENRTVTFMTNASADPKIPKVNRKILITERGRHPSNAQYVGGIRVHEKELDIWINL